MKLFSFVHVLVLPVVVLGLAACNGDDDGPGDPTGPTGPFDLTFNGDASFQGAHGDQSIYVVLEASDGELLASESGVVSGSDDPAFSFTFSDVLEENQVYQLKYWIDSNFGGGTEGVCDPPGNDHQWRLEVGPVTEDVTVADTHRPAETESVCSSFAADLDFTGDATFQGAHGGQAISVAVVHQGLGQVVARESGTVSGAEDPSFSFSFPGVLVRGAEYEIHYWIDSNFGGGTEGVCDPPGNDHQWRLEVGPVTEDVTVADTHRPGETESVCSSFE